jgi:hypothetical protein
MDNEVEAVARVLRATNEVFEDWSRDDLLSFVQIVIEALDWYRGMEKEKD